MAGSTIGHRLAEVLQAAWEEVDGAGTGLTVAEIRQRYRARFGSVNEQALLRCLSDGRRFTRRTGDRYLLIEHADALTLTAPLETPRGDSPTVFRLPELFAGEWAIVDVETTGTDPARDRVFQVAAVRFMGERPVAVFNRYLSTTPLSLSEGLKRRLGISGDPVLEQLIADASEPGHVLPDLLSVMDGIPWVAHNARFDRDFLTALGLSTPFYFDTLELAGLCLPTAPSLAEGEVAAALGLDPMDIAQDPRLAPLLIDIDGPNVYGGYHNALTDVLQLARVFFALRERVDPAVMSALWRFAANLPLFVEDEIPTLLAQAGVTSAASPVAPVALPDAVPDPVRALRQYLADRGRGSRPTQETMLRYTAEAWDAGESCACEAPTGTGKTLAYLFPALCHALRTGQQAVVSTATKNLQDQLADELTSLSAWADEGGAERLPPFTWAVRKGAGNYLCRERLRSALVEAARRPRGQVAADEAFALLYGVSFALRSQEGLLEEMPAALLRRFPALELLREEVRAGTGCRAEGEGMPHANCPQAALRARFAGANLVVMNHALWMTLRQSRPDAVANVGVVAVDEAHELEDVATARAEQSCNGAVMAGHLRRLYDPDRESGLLVMARGRMLPSGAMGAVTTALGVVRRILRGPLPEMGRVLREFCRRQRLGEDPRYGVRLTVPPFPTRTLGYRWRDVERAWRDLSDAGVLPLCESLTEALAPREGSESADSVTASILACVTRLKEMAETGGAVLNPRDRRAVCVLDIGPSDAVDRGEEGIVLRNADDAPPPAWSLTRTPVDVAAELAAAYGGLPVLFTSATMDTGEASGGPPMRYALDRVGLGSVPRHRRYLLPPVLPYATNAAFAIARAPVYAPLAHTQTSFTAEFADATTRLVTLAEGRTLILFTARSRMEAMTDSLRRYLTDGPDSAGWETPPVVGAVLTQGDDLPHRLVERFRREPNTVLAGVRRFWQGVDVPGDALRLVFLEKLPFPAFHDPLVAARAARVERHGGNPFADYLLPGMLIAFKQGFGRLLRAGDDRGAVILFDRRAATKTYLSRLEACLPGFVARDPRAESTWGGLVGHLEGAIPGLFPGLSARSESEIGRLLPGRLAAPDAPCPTLPLPFPTDAPDDDFADALAAFGHTGFRSGEQRRVTRAQLEHRDVLGLIPTGGGKSLTFQLPALVAQEGLTLVISPLIALMRDQVEHLSARGFENVAALYSGQGSEERADILQRARLDRLRILYVAPERLRDPVLLETLRRTRVRALVVDEAHCLYSWGPHFRPEFLALPELFRHIGRVPVAALTATAPPSRRREILQALGLNLDETETVVASFARPELRFFVYGPASRHNRIVGPQSKLTTLLKILTAARRDGDSAVVYVNTTSGAEELASQLQLAGFGARAYHGRMETASRNDVQDLFMDDHIRVVVCTKAFGMGVDKSGVRYVIHYDVPGDLVAYAQEAGRAGRSMAVGQYAYCVLLYHPKDGGIHEWFNEQRLPDEMFLRAVAEDLRTNAHPEGNRLLYGIVDATQRLAEMYPDLEETAVNVALYRLGTLGFLQREADAISRALIARAPGAEALAPLQGEAPVVTEAVRVLLAGAPEGRQVDSTPVDLLDQAQRHGWPLIGLSEALATRAVAGQLLLAPVARAAVFQALGPLLAGEIPLFGDAERSRLRTEASEGWEAMRSYAAQSAGCRSVTLLSHLGEPTEPVPCGICDLCNSDQTRPWGDITDDDVPCPSEYIEAPGLLLEAIYWNENRHRDGERGPLGEKTLWAVLAGEEFYLKRYNRYAAARRCPFYGVFKSLRGRRAGIQRLFERLVQHGYCIRQTRSIGAEPPDMAEETGAGPTSTYTVPKLTARGYECVQTGRYVDFDAP